MSSKFHPIPLPRLLRFTLDEIRQGRFMGIPSGLFFRPDPSDPFRLMRYGRMLDTPLGVAAGPHTQLAQNIVAAWLCGARYIELKTIQTLDELEVSKPCIDMQDEGYNCEWSQELRITESYTEYLNAWIIIHILHRELGFSGPCGTLFNMSAGYDLAGIMRDNVQWFLGKMSDSTSEISQARELIRPVYPEIDQVVIPALISDHITLSTMHGCPPGEIGQIGNYLLMGKRLHTTVKLNPTLLGAAELRSILNDRLGFTAEVPDQAFEHDLKYPDALHLLGMLSETARVAGVEFGVKLSNTLESLNNRTVFNPEEKMMYLSGRALHPVTVALAERLQKELKGGLDISFSSGADCFNVAEIIACGMKPVTVCSDLLKPGGYGRLRQYIDNLQKAFEEKGAGNIDDLILKKAASDPGEQVRTASLHNLEAYDTNVTDDPLYHKSGHVDLSVKTSRTLGMFDCIHAPCTDTCPAHQDIPEYLHHTAQHDFRAAAGVIARTNPFPSVTGMVCDHPCQLKCTRVNYDEAIRIREVKRFVAAREPVTAVPDSSTGKKAAIVGAGPSGLSCAWYLRQSGFEVEVFEQKKVPGGMVSSAIPSFRLTPAAIEDDIRRILESGVRLRTSHAVGRDRLDALLRNYDAVFLAAGAQKAAGLRIEGSDAYGVTDPLAFLYEIKINPIGFRGKHVVVIGGGNTAMDAARTAWRLVGDGGSVTIVYRRTALEMPADRDEIVAARQEGIQIIELAGPKKIVTENGRVISLICERNSLEKDRRGQRLVPVPIPGSDFRIACDTVIPAVGQMPVVDMTDPDLLRTEPGSHRTQIPKLYTGGDLMRGASTVINAIADGRRAAMEIIADTSSEPGKNGRPDTTQPDIPALLVRKATRAFGKGPDELPPSRRRNFNLVIHEMTEEEAINESARCLQCDTFCNVCVSVCPNLANFGYSVEPAAWQLQKVVKTPDGVVQFVTDSEFSVSQAYQVLNIRDLCNECGNCTTFCPSSGRPFADKPGLSITRESFETEECGFLLETVNGAKRLLYKEPGELHSLRIEEEHYLYTNGAFSATLGLDDLRPLKAEFPAGGVNEVSLHRAAQMSIVLKGALQLGLTEP